MERTKARAWTATAKGAGGVLVAVAVTASLLPVGRPSITEATVSGGEATPVSATPPKAYEPDTELILTVLEELNPRPFEETPAETPATGATVAGPAVLGPSDWRFVGTIITPRRSMAMVMIGEKQELLAEGSEAHGVRLVAVTPSHITLEENGARHDVQLAPKTTTWPDARTGRLPRTGVTAGATPSPAIPPSMRGRGSAAEDEQIQQMERERQEQAQREQEEAERRAKAGMGPSTPPQPAPGAPMRATPTPGGATPPARPNPGSTPKPVNGSPPR